MSRVKSPLTVVVEFLAARYRLHPADSVRDAECLMDRLARCRLPEEKAVFKLNDPLSVADRVLVGVGAMERMELDPLFVHEVRRLVASVKSLNSEQHQPLIQAVLAHAESQALCEAKDPPEEVWQRNDELNRALDDVVQTYVDAKRKEYSNEC